MSETGTKRKFVIDPAGQRKRSDLAVALAGVGILELEEGGIERNPPPRPQPEKLTWVWRPCGSARLQPRSSKGWSLKATVTDPAPGSFASASFTRMTPAAFRNP